MHRLAWCILFALAALGVACVGALSSCAVEPAPAVAALVTEPPWTIHTISSAYQGADGHALGDVDQDGDADIAVAWEQSARIAHQRSAVRHARPAGAGPYQAGALADVDGDGDLDAVTTPGEAAAPAGPRWFEAPTWTEHVIADAGGKWDELDLVDVDADGDLDVVSTEQVLGLGAVWLERP